LQAQRLHHRAIALSSSAGDRDAPSGHIPPQWFEQNPYEEGEDDVTGPGRGFVNVFDANGNRIHRVASRGALNAPWGVALAPADFGKFSGALLIGNFGDGRINAYDLATHDFRGPLATAAMTPISIDGLWGIAFGNGVAGQPVNVLFFAAGPDDEEHGLYGRIEAVPAQP
jgi:uncharacterized protein (TIGR03118 family)